MQRALLDNSAWARLRPPSRVPAPRRAEVARAIEAGDIFVCAPFLMEAYYSARSALEHDELRCELESLPSSESMKRSRTVRWRRRDSSRAPGITGCPRPT